MPVVKVPNVRLSFPDLFVAKAVNGEGEPKFGAAFVVPPDSPAAAILAGAMAEAATLKWGPKAPGILADLKAKGKVCYQERPKTNASGEVYDGFEGMHQLNARNDVRPAVIDRDTTPLTSADGKPYSGCYVDCSVDVWAQDNAWGRRVNAKLRWVQFRADGDAFTGGAPVSQDEFESIAEGAAAGDLV